MRSNFRVSVEVKVNLAACLFAVAWFISLFL